MVGEYVSIGKTDLDEKQIKYRFGLLGYSEDDISQILEKINALPKKVHLRSYIHNFPAMIAEYDKVHDKWSSDGWDYYTYIYFGPNSTAQSIMKIEHVGMIFEGVKPGYNGPESVLHKRFTYRCNSVDQLVRLCNESTSYRIGILDNFKPHIK